jgi:predicted alpha-1,2-mannosidase
MNLKFLIALFFASQIYCSAQSTKYSSQVNPFIGTGGTGHTFPGAVVPFGMVQLSPDTRIDGSWEGCGGYHYSDSIIYGFSHTHLSGTGVSDYGDILIMPTLSETYLKPNEYATLFSHANEKASAGYYQVTLNNNIQARLTATERVGIHEYSFPKSQNSQIIIDLLHRDKTLKSTLKIIDSVTIQGYRVSEGWASEQYVYFYLKLSKPILQSKLNIINSNKKHPYEVEQITGGIFQFDNSDNKPLTIKVGISQTSTEGAKINLETEASHWIFNAYKSDAENKWEKELSKIDIKTNDSDKATIFYTALYHCLIHPNLAGDVDGKYRGRDSKIHQAKGYIPYTVFSLWDTFRALHPLYTLIEKKRTSDIINSFLAQYKEGGRLPMWELSANETNCMIGFHSVSVIADAMTKNITGFNKQTVLESIVAAANYTNLGIPTFNKNNYLQIDDESESVSKTLEYAYDNWCIAQIYQKLNKTNFTKTYLTRAQAYKNLFDKNVSFMRPRKNGNWLSPFEPKEVNNHYTEANSWQYTFFVPQDITGLISLFGGEKKFEQKLDELFNTSAETLGRTQVDITGLIGQYAHGNEPSHHMSYLYNYIGKPQKTQEKTYQILTEFYKNNPDGLIGNEDCGQMSAWYVLSSMGIYQVCPGQPEYTIGSPLFNEVSIKFENGKKFEIVKQNPKSNFQYIQSTLLNKTISNSSSILHNTLVSGGKLEFILTDKIDDKSMFGKSVELRPHTEIIDYAILTAPTINVDGKTTDSLKVITINHPEHKAELYYTLNGTEPTEKSNLFSKPLKIDSTVIIKAKAYYKKESSSIATSYIYKKPNNWKITLLTEYNKQYDAGGNNGIIDGQHGTLNWKSGGWQGYQREDLDCIIDLGKLTSIQYINTSFLQDTRSWIIFPKQVEYSISEDGVTYNSLGIIENGVAADDYSLQMRTFYNTKKVTARYVKVKAINYGVLPPWHQGFGGDAFIFVDEIEIK